jgi:lipoprotein-releasing system permease protein
VPVVKLPSDVYPVEYLPVKVQLSDLALIALTSVVISVLACLYPAKKAAKLYPAEILRQG